MSKPLTANAGFWLAIGVSAGLLLANITSGQVFLQSASASGSASRYEQYCTVTGASYDQEVDVLWLLDYKTGLLHNILIGRNGKMGAIGELDLMQMFDIEQGQREKPHFMMVTGRYRTAQTDLCYLIETVSGQILCLAPPPTPQQNVGIPATPRVIDRFRFRADPNAQPANGSSGRRRKGG